MFYIAIVMYRQPFVTRGFFLVTGVAIVRSNGPLALLFWGFSGSSFSKFFSAFVEVQRVNDVCNDHIIGKLYCTDQKLAAGEVERFVQLNVCNSACD